MKPISTILTLILLGYNTLFAQENCTDRYRKQVFDRVALDGQIDFDAWTKYNTGQILRYDVYMPKDDTAKLRPLLILLHGGAYVDLLKKNSPDIVRMAKDFAKMGYVVISPDYRGIRNLLDFLNKEKLVKHVIEAILDANDAICHILNQIDNEGNPYRINRDEIFAAGVSAGAVSILHGLFVDNLDDIDPQYAQWAREVDGGRADAVINNKFCTGGENVIKGFISISGALLDTAYMHKIPTRMLLIHGDKDDILPFNVGQPLGGFTAAPDLYGAKPIQEKAEQIGQESELVVYQGRGHVPYLNLDIADLLQSFNLFDEDLYQFTLNKMTDFMMQDIQCEMVSQDTSLTTGIKDFKNHELQLYPNPTPGVFTLDLPDSKAWQLQILDITGKLLLQSNFNGRHYQQDISPLPKGVYLVQVHRLGSFQTIYYGKIMKQD